MFSRSLIAALLASSSACVSFDAESTNESEAVGGGGGPYFEIHSLGDRCVDAALVNTDGVGNLVIRPCTGVPTQIFKFSEIDFASHDVQIMSYSANKCVAMDGTASQGRRLALRPCAPLQQVTTAQRFAWDGDALLVGNQLDGERVNRDFVTETLDSDTRSGTPVVVGTREVNDAEYWWLKAVGNALHPHSGFVNVTGDYDLGVALDTSTWGTVIEAAPKNTDDIELRNIPMKKVLHAGVTLRGNRKGVFNGTRLFIPPTRQLADGDYFIRMEDRARITGLRIEGDEASGGSANCWGVLLGGDPQFPTDVPNAILDHNDISHWSEMSVVVWDKRESAGRFECPMEPERTAPPAKIAGNFIHHGKAYGVDVGAGGAALLTGNLLFRNVHDITASYVGYNRYLAYDNLFTGETNGESSAIFDVHGSCGVHYWDGGIAGDFFDVAWNSFLSSRNPTFSIRGSTCDHAEFRNNISTNDGDPDTIKVSTKYSDDPKAPLDCFDAPGHEYLPKSPAAILWTNNNRFDIANPLRQCPRRNGMSSTSCATGDIAVGDFDGDGIDDLFFGSGITWWYSAGGTAEWRFLSRKAPVASDLRFGDFDADGRTDVIALVGRDIQVSWAGISPWFTINSITDPAFDKPRIDDIAVGTFDNRPGADLFISNGLVWRTSSRGTGTWQSFGGFGFRTNKLRFADFDDDGRTDVFAVVGSQWRIWNSALAQTVTLGPAYVTNIDALVVAGLQDTGKADVVYSSGTQWMVSRAGVAAPTVLRNWGANIVTLPIGQFDGLDGADVLQWNDRWLYLAPSGGPTDVPWSRQSMY